MYFQGFNAINLLIRIGSPVGENIARRWLLVHDGNTKSELYFPIDRDDEQLLILMGAFVKKSPIILLL